MVINLSVEVNSEPEEDLSSQSGGKKMVFGRLSSTQFRADHGEVIESDDTIILEGVPIITPNRDIVVPSLSFEVRALFFSGTWNHSMEVKVVYTKAGQGLLTQLLPPSGPVLGCLVPLIHSSLVQQILG